MWTSDADSSATSTKGTAKGHNRIVRIPPGESVVLNSAERAPYLLIIEVLVGELDFNPSKRANREILKRMIAKDNKIDTDINSNFRALTHRPTMTAPSAITNGPVPAQRPRSSTRVAFIDDPVINIEPDVADPVLDTYSSQALLPALAITSEAPEEEMDLVEQIYGADLSVRSQPADLSESIVLPPTPKNKALDMAAWAKASSSGASSPAQIQTPRADQSGLAPHSPFPSTTPHTPTSNASSVQTTNMDGERSPLHQRALSLEDYSERMKTAAIMLAQLNANLIREPVTTVTPSPGAAHKSTVLPIQANSIPSGSSPSGTWSWVSSGANWIRGSSSGTGSDGQPIGMRMKLQPAEATAIRDRIMQEMMALEEERMERMRETNEESHEGLGIGEMSITAQTAEDEGIVRRELNKVDPSGE
jgi:phosphatidylinositol 4-kinase B